ncbi:MULTISPECIES: aspartate ammonia-lyase [Vagococcus]|uniref:Aspartate ammonia-lyase n=1 Tax=Vagococcus fluvialis bH819 TaxID=1255619 RepID=A0A1X6WNP2_9ENTE|nr:MULTISPECIES: aspartate ammonia-lyase [Vagococcus]SLM85934.1 Aspartate ammonia-lyase [Vagococcus fluvialis bH819]HCM88301.1 aspartate ammonia-lyase [Vagococcus sp.]
MMYRTERDSVGELEVPVDSYYGVHSLRAKINFPITNQTLDQDFIISLAQVKKAAALANHKLGLLPDLKTKAIVQASDEIISGKLHDQFIVDPIQGGAGTSSNMNVNEVITNRAIELLGGVKGDFSVIHPNDDVNKGQSTNDVYPTAGKLTMLKKIPALMVELERLKDVFEEKSNEFKDILKLGRTQLSDAVPITLGQEFHAYYTVTKRNMKRLEHVKSEMETINLGGTAIGTGITAHPELSETVVPYLNTITDEVLVTSDDLVDGTQNIEQYVILSDVLKSIAISLSKIANDIRLLSSGPNSGIGEITIPARQNGSSIMPGKINPVIPEVVTQCSFVVMGNNAIIGSAAEAGQLELNAFEPVVFYKLLESFQVLTNGISTFVDHCVSGIEANEARCKDNLERSTYLATVLSETIGYTKAADIAKVSLTTGKTIREVAESQGIQIEMKEKKVSLVK